MDISCLEHRLTDEERTTFERDGCFAVEDAISQEQVAGLTAALDRLDAERRVEKELGPYNPINYLDFIGKDEAFLPLLDYEKIFPKVCDILGWNIQLYHSHFIHTPAHAADHLPETRRINWHQDSGRLNQELETTPQPRVSLKVAYFLSDTTELGRANLYVIPGSQNQNKLTGTKGEDGQPEGALPIKVKAGTAVFFDRRIWHASSPNYSDIARKVLFYGYSYRWLRPRDNMTVGHYLDRCDPIQRQLLGVSPNGGFGYTSPADEDVPLRAWLREHTKERAVAA